MSESNIEYGSEVLPPDEAPTGDFSATIESGLWKVNTWYNAQFDCLVYAMLSGKTPKAYVYCDGIVWENSQYSHRAKILVTGSLQKGLGGDYRIAGVDTLTFPVFKGEWFRIQPTTWTMLPDGYDYSIKVIPYPRPE